MDLMKFLNRYRWLMSWFELCKDGEFKKEYLKGKNKKIARKRTLKKIKELQIKE